MANTFHTRPSTLLGIDPADVYLAYCIDHAILVVGMFPEPEKDTQELRLGITGGFE